MQRNITLATSLCSEIGQDVPINEAEHITYQPDWILLPSRKTSYTGSSSSYDSTSDDAHVDGFSTVSHSWKRASPFSHDVPSKSPSSSLYGTYPWNEERIRRKTPHDSLVESQSDEEEGTEAYEGTNENQGDRAKSRSEIACSQGVKRKLQSASLALSIGIFRARRRVRKALG